LNTALKKKKRTRESKKESQQQLGWVAARRGIFLHNDRRNTSIA
jgi:hypothetical protein